MGHDGGELILIFRSDGGFDFPTNMKFNPQFTQWAFDEQRQVLELSDDAGKVYMTFTPPEIVDRDQYLYITDRSQRLVNFTYIDPIFDLPLAPAPLYDRPRHTYSGTSPFILQLGSQPELATNAADWDSPSNNSPQATIPSLLGNTFTNSCSTNSTSNKSPSSVAIINSKRIHLKTVSQTRCISWISLN